MTTSSRTVRLPVSHPEDHETQLRINHARQNALTVVDQLLDQIDAAIEKAKSDNLDREGAHFQWLLDNQFGVHAAWKALRIENPKVAPRPIES